MRRIAIAAALVASAIAPATASAGRVALSDPKVGASSTMYRMIVNDDNAAISGGRRYDIRLSWTTAASGKIVPTIRAWARVGGSMHALPLFRVAGPDAATNQLPAGSTFINFTPIVITNDGFSFQVRAKEPGKAAHTFGWIAVSKTTIGSAG